MHVCVRVRVCVCVCVIAVNHIPNLVVCKLERWPHSGAFDGWFKIGHEVTPWVKTKSNGNGIPVGSGHQRKFLAHTVGEHVQAILGLGVRG